jgi:hypothetical protein
MKRILLILSMLLIFLSGHSQAKIILNGGIINITNGAVLVVDNPDNTAIIQTGSGYIKSEGASNRIIWTIGTGNGNNYLVPFGNASNYLPLNFKAAFGSDASGKFIFSTYPTATWKNSDYLPPGVSNVNSSGIDNSANVIDRFWQINPQGYTTKPSLTNLIFTYSDNEYAVPNTIAEAALIAQRWNSVAQMWDDYFPVSSISTVNNTITVSSINGSQLFDWWTMVSSSSALPVTLVYFKASVQNQKVVTAWQTVSEQNSSYFEVWRSKNAQQFDSVGRLAAAGNSTSVLNYTFTDKAPYSNTSYYRLKTVDQDGKFKWSPIVSVNIEVSSDVLIYPNPATDYLIISSSVNVINKKPIAKLYDAKGKLLKYFVIKSTNQQLNITTLSAGEYHIAIIYDNQTQTLSFIKK